MRVLLLFTALLLNGCVSVTFTALPPGIKIGPDWQSVRARALDQDWQEARRKYVATRREARYQHRLRMAARYGRRRNG